jgi:hypothetical protein
MSPSHHPQNPPLARTTFLASSSGILSAPISSPTSTPTSTPKPRTEGESTNPPYQRKHRRTPAVSVPSASIAERSSYRTTPPPPFPRIPSSYAPRRGDSSEERDIPRPLPRGTFGRERFSRNQPARREKDIVPPSVERGKSSAAGGAMRRSESSSFPSRSRPENVNPSQGQLRGLTPSRLPRSSSTNWRSNVSPVFRPRAGADIEKSPQRVTTTKITPFITKMPRIEKQPHQESYLMPLPAEGTLISPEGGLVGQQGGADPVHNNTSTSHSQHRRTNAVHIPRSSTEYRFQEAITRRPSGQQECASPRLVTTHLAPFVVMAPPRTSLSRASPPSQSRPRPAVLTGVRHTSESSLMITQRQLLQPLGPPVPRSRTMSALTPLAAFTANPRQVCPTLSSYPVPNTIPPTP